MTTGGVPDLKVDPKQLSQLGNALLTAAKAIPEPPDPLVVTGADAISRAIANKVPEIETPIQEGLPQVKIDAETTASNIIAAADKYLGTDEQLAANYERHQFDAAASGGAGGLPGGAADSAGSAVGGPGTASSVGAQLGSMGQLGQMVGMPMQMLGAVASVPQGAMQGVQSAMQQIGKITEGLGGDKRTPDEDDVQAEPDKGSERPDEPQKFGDHEGAAADASQAERPPATGAPPEHQAPAPRQVPSENLPGTPLTAEPEGRINL